VNYNTLAGTKDLQYYFQITSFHGSGQEPIHDDKKLYGYGFSVYYQTQTYKGTNRP